MEILIIVMIIVIIASVAIPSYQNHLRNNARADGKSGLMQVANHLERYFTEHETYTTDLAALGAPTKSPDGFYNLSIKEGPNGIATSYVVVGKISTKDGDPECSSIALASNGQKTATSSKCW